MAAHDRLDQLSNDEFSTIWNAAGTIDEVVERVVIRVGRVPRWSVMARAVALRKGGADPKVFDLPAPRTVTPSSSPSPASAA